MQIAIMHEVVICVDGNTKSRDQSPEWVNDNSTISV